MESFPYYSHTVLISLGILLGVVWEAYHKGVPLLGALEIPLEKGVGNLAMYIKFWELRSLWFQ